MKLRVWILVNPGESHPEQRGHGSPRESRGERCEDRKGFPRWGKLTSVHASSKLIFLAGKNLRVFASTDLILA